MDLRRMQNELQALIEAVTAKQLALNKTALFVHDLESQGIIVQVDLVDLAVNLAFTLGVDPVPAPAPVAGLTDAEFEAVEDILAGSDEEIDLIELIDDEGRMGNLPIVLVGDAPIVLVGDDEHDPVAAFAAVGQALTEMAGQIADTAGQIADVLEPAVDGQIAHPTPLLPEYSPDWAPDMEARLRELRAAGYRPKQIATEFGRTEKAIHSKLARMGIKDVADPVQSPVRPPRLIAPPEKSADWTPGMVARLRQMRTAGASHKAMAQELGRTEKAIGLKVTRLNALDRAAAAGTDAPPPAPRPPRPSVNDPLAVRLDRLKNCPLWPMPLNLQLAVHVKARKTMAEIAVLIGGGLTPEDITAQLAALCPNRARIGALDELIAALRDRVAA